MQKQVNAMISPASACERKSRTRRASPSIRRVLERSVHYVSEERPRLVK